MSDGNSLVTVSFDGTVKIWDVATGEELMTFSEDEGGGIPVDFSSNLNYLATAGEDSIVNIWDVSSRLLVTTIDSLLDFDDDLFGGMDFSPDGDRLAIGGKRETAVSL